MTAWIRSEEYSRKKCPVYFHPAYEYALAKEKYPRPIGVCLRKLSMMRHEEFLVGIVLSIS